jgi:hypothetical protein
MIPNNLNDYRRELLKLNESRCTKITKTYYSKYIIRSIKKEYHLDINEDLYSKIIRRINELLTDLLLEGQIIKFPYNMGILYICSNKGKLYMKDNLLINTSRANWKATIELWYNNEKARKNKTVVKDLTTTIYKVKYSTNKISYKNRQYYSFKTSRTLKNKITNHINNNIIIPCYECTLHNN